jgi:hypothetical protein
MSTERTERSQSSLYQDADIISAVRRGDIERLNKLLAKLEEPTPRDEASVTHPRSDGAFGR